MVKIIGISGIGGSGKSVVTKALGKALGATMIFWDDFDEISKDPEDLIEWYNSTQDYSKWKYDSLAEVLKELKTGKKVICPATKKELIPTQYIVFDAPLGRRHTETGKYIDYSIFLNTSLDVALARRVLRDFRDQSNLNIAEIFEELDFYLTTSRPLYAMNYTNMELHNFIADGNEPLDILTAKILKQIKLDELVLRKIQQNDIEKCISLFQQTVHSVNQKDYTQEQLNAWAPLVEPKLIDNYLYWETLLKNIAYIAESNHELIGFGDITHEGYLDRLFIHKDFQRLGIATLIVETLENEAIKQGIKEITTHASITAKPFFEKMGFAVTKEQQWPILGIKLTNYVMKKRLSRD